MGYPAIPYYPKIKKNWENHNCLGRYPTSLGTHSNLREGSGRLSNCGLDRHSPLLLINISLVVSAPFGVSCILFEEEALHVIAAPKSGKTCVLCGMSRRLLLAPGKWGVPIGTRGHTRGTLRDHMCEPCTPPFTCYVIILSLVHDACHSPSCVHVSNLFSSRLLVALLATFVTCITLECT